MKIAASQIEDLYAFTRAHFVEWYDLQTELVDHLANDIEAIWQEQPTLSYTEARDFSFKKFGVFGFMDVVENRQKAMGKTYRKYLFLELKKWFEWPQIIATLALFLIFLMSFLSSISKPLLVTFYLAGIFWAVYKLFRLKRVFKKRKEISNKKWLLEEMLFKQSGVAGVVLASQVGNVFNIPNEIFENSYIVIALAAVITLLFLINYISFEVLPNKAEELLKKTYPEFVL